MAEDAQIIIEQALSSLLEGDINEEMLEKEQESRKKRTNQTFSYSSSSKRKFVIEESNWGASLEERQSPGYQIGTQTGPRRDKLRDAAGKYWGYDKISGGTQSVIFIKKGHQPNKHAGVPFRMWVSEPFYNPSPENFAGEKNPFFEVKQVVRLTPDKRAFTPSTGKYKNIYRSGNWRLLISGRESRSAQGTTGIISELVDYRYLSFDMAMPFNYRELDDLNVVGPQYAKIRPEYNFYIKNYEEMLRFGEGLNQPETVFPNLYALMLEKISEVSNPVFANHISLGSTIKGGEATIGAAKKNKFDIKKHSGQYFNIYGERFSAALEGAIPSVAELGQKFRNIVVPVENVSLLKEVSGKKELFPMFVDMEFSTDKTTEFAQMLSDTMLTNDFIWAMVRDVVSSTGFNEAGFVEALETSNMEIQEDGTTTVTKNTSTKSSKRRVWNILSWLKNNSLVDFSTGAIKTPDFTAESEESALKSTTLLDDGTIEDNMTVEPKNKFFRSLMGVIFLGKLKTFLKDRTRTYDEIMEGLPCHTETVLYRVEKTLADEAGNPTGNAIQNFWFPNTNQIDILNLVDTQIKYGKSYAYRIYAYQLCVGTNYSYSRMTYDDNKAAFVVTQNPEVLLIEQDIFTDNHLIVDDPPVPPEIDIVPYFANGNKLLFNLKSAVGEYLLDPIALNEEDVAAHTKIRKAQKVDADEPIRFKSDDPVGLEGYFEIYRLEEHPKAWSDFDGQLLVTIANNPTHGSTTILGASSAEYIDRIASNRKYYYTCRMVDVHGHTSNPTVVYEVELVNDEGSVYMTKRPVEFLPVEPKHPSKSMRRLLQIKPAMEQTFIDSAGFGSEESALQVKNVKLGERQESPWGGKYKFRLISRKTGKKMDLNIDFNAIMEKKSTLK